jgi:hypothetical protein
MDLKTILLQTSSAYWNNVIQNSIAGTIGSLIAIVVSILIYKWTTKDGEAAKKEAIALKESNQLKAFGLMIQNGIKMATDQSKAISAFIEELKKQPNEFPKILIHPLGNLKRIIDTITIEETGLSYMKHFSGINAAKEFTSILNYVDYLYAEFYQLEGLVQRATLNDYDRKMEVSKMFDYANKLVLDYIIHIQPTDSLGQRIKQIKNDFDQNRGRPDNLNSVKNLFFIPLNEFLQDILNRGIKTPFYLELFYASSKGREYFEYIESGYLKFENEMKGIETEVNTNLPKLKLASVRILNSKYVSA